MSEMLLKLAQFCSGWLVINHLLHFFFLSGDWIKKESHKDRNDPPTPE
jgi:hypothetical protein